MGSSMLNEIIWFVQYRWCIPTTNCYQDPCWMPCEREAVNLLCLWRAHSKCNKMYIIIHVFVWRCSTWFWLVMYIFLLWFPKGNGLSGAGGRTTSGQKSASNSCHRWRRMYTVHCSVWKQGIVRSANFAQYNLYTCSFLRIHLEYPCTRGKEYLLLFPRLYFGTSWFQQ